MALPNVVVIDGGNSLFTDTIRRTRRVEDAGMLYVGSGISGGEEGALTGPSLMPGGDRSGYDEMAPMLTKETGILDWARPAAELAARALLTTVH